MQENNLRTAKWIENSFLWARSKSCLVFAEAIFTQILSDPFG